MKVDDINNFNLKIELLEREYEGIISCQTVEIINLRNQNEAILKSIEKKSDSIDKRLNMLSKSMILAIIQCLIPNIIVWLLLNK